MGRGKTTSSALRRWPGIVFCLTGRKEKTIAITPAKGFQGFPRVPEIMFTSTDRKERPSQALLAEIPKAFLEPLEATRSIRPILLAHITGGSSSWMWDGGIGQIGQAANPGLGYFD